MRLLKQQRRVLMIPAIVLLIPVIFQMAEVAVPRELFWAILEGIQRLRLPMPAPG